MKNKSTKTYIIGGIIAVILLVAAVFGYTQYFGDTPELSISSVSREKVCEYTTAKDATFG